jgi:hypothetical protein
MNLREHMASAAASILEMRISDRMQRINTAKELYRTTPEMTVEFAVALLVSAGMNEDTARKTIEEIVR